MGTHGVLWGGCRQSGAGGEGKDEVRAQWICGTSFQLRPLGAGPPISPAPSSAALYFVLFLHHLQQLGSQEWEWRLCGLEPRVRCSAPPEHCREHPLNPTGCVTLKHLGSPWHSSWIHHTLHYWRYCVALTRVSEIELVPFRRTLLCSPLPRKATSATGGPRPQLWPLLSGHELPLKSQPDWAGAQKGRAMQRSQHHQGSLVSARPAPSELSLFLSASRPGYPEPT